MLQKGAGEGGKRFWTRVQELEGVGVVDGEAWESGGAGGAVEWQEKISEAAWKNNIESHQRLRGKEGPPTHALTYESHL